MRLSNVAFPFIAKAGNVALPTYDRADVTPGILHVGVGNFHRAHMAAYVDDLMNSDFDTHKGWGIVGAGLYSSKKRDELQAQDWMQTLVERDADYEKASVIGCMTDFLPVDNVKKEHKAIRDALADPKIKIVSMTVTEGGYYLHDGKFDKNDAEIQHDIQNPDSPQTVFGMIVHALGKRRDSGAGPFTVMSCDNVPHNGDVVRSVVVGLASEINKDLAKWIEENVTFPNAMVDRIVPATTDATRTFVLDKYGYVDDIPVFCEPFRQWVVEDNFCAGRPKWENCEGVTFVEDVSPYEIMKLRILNGGHASLCYPAALLGVEYVHEAMEHPTIRPFLDALESNEIIPTVPPVPDTSLPEYWEIIAKRFSNPTIEDTIVRNCFDGASRQPKFIVPVAKEAMVVGCQVNGLATVSAMWCRYCQGKTEAGEAIEPNDPKWDKLQELAKKASKDPKVWLSMSDVYGDVGNTPQFVEAFTKALKLIENEGVEAAMKHYIEICDLCEIPGFGANAGSAAAAA